jgi:hypothetical protein
MHQSTGQTAKTTTLMDHPLHRDTAWNQVPLALGEAAPPWIETGPTGQPFDFTSAMRALIEDICRRVAEFQHIRVPELLIGYVPSRNNRTSGLQARITPLRFAGGELTKEFRGQKYQVQQVRYGGFDILYLLAFSLPRFLNRSFDDKCVTIFHELYHIGPNFDGDLRRHPGRCEFHTGSKSRYDEQMKHLVRQYLADGADPRWHGFLRLNSKQLHQRHGQVVGVKIPRIRVFPVATE